MQTLRSRSRFEPVPLPVLRPAATEAPAQPSLREPVVVAAAANPRQAHPGDIVTLTVEIKMESGWHIGAVNGAGELSIPTRLDLKLPGGLTTAGDGDVPKPDPGIAKSGPAYVEEVRFTRQLKVSADAAPGTIELECKVAYQACDESHCLRPMHAKLRVPLEIGPKP